MQKGYCLTSQLPWRRLKYGIWDSKILWTGEESENKWQMETAENGRN